MAFRFSLAALLRTREIAEQREERLLGQILNQLASCRQTLAGLESQRCSLCAQRELALQQSTYAFELLGFYSQMKRVDEMEAAGREHLAKLLTLRQQQIKIYEASLRNRELLSGMKTARLEVFRTEQVRKEQNAMDDNFSARRGLS